MIPLGDYAPDRAQLGSGLASVAKNVIPGPPGEYGPLTSLSAYSSGALGAKCLGFAFIKKTDGSTRIIAGDGAALYELQADLSWSDISKAGGYSVAAGEFWNFRLFGTTLIAHSGSVTPQAIDVDSGTQFADLAGSPPLARYSANIGPHVMFASLNTEPMSVQACAAADATNWNTGGNANGIKQEFKNHGWVRGVSPGRIAGHVYQDSAVWRASLTDDNALFQFDLIADDLGLLAPTSLCQRSEVQFFLGNDGFYKFDGQMFTRIGEGRLDETFLADVQQNSLALTYGAIDPKRSIVYWLYYSGSATTYADKVLIYNYLFDRWSHGEIDASVMAPVVTLATTLDDLDTLFPAYKMDTFPWSLDDRILQGNAPALAMFGSDNKLSTFSSSNLAAEIETAEVQIYPGSRAFVQGVTPLFEGTTTAPTVSLGAKERSSDTFAFGSDVGLEVTGECPQRSSGRFHRARIKITAAEDWSKVFGVDYRAVKDGSR